MTLNFTQIGQHVWEVLLYIHWRPEVKYGFLCAEISRIINICEHKLYRILSKLNSKAENGGKISFTPFSKL